MTILIILAIKLVLVAAVFLLVAVNFLAIAALNAVGDKRTAVSTEAVLAWAEARRKRRTYVVHACMPYDGLGLLRLQGSDPNAS